MRREANHRELFAIEQRQVSIGRKVDPRRGRLALQRADPRMGILDVEDRIILRCFDHLRKVEVEHRIGALGKHDEAHYVLADFLDHLGQGDRLAGAEQAHHLDQLDVEVDAPVG